jgi:hypothetical protein
LSCSLRRHRSGRIACTRRFSGSNIVVFVNRDVNGALGLFHPNLAQQPLESLLARRIILELDIVNGQRPDRLSGEKVQVVAVRIDQADLVAVRGCVERPQQLGVSIVALRRHAVEEVLFQSSSPQICISQASHNA